MAGFNICSGVAKRDTLFIHGNLASARWWSPLFKNWAQRGSLGPGRLVAFDLAGCGDLPPWPGHQELSLRGMAEDILHKMDSLRVDKADLVGHSLGGLIALQILTLAPDRVNKCVLLSSVGAEGMVFENGMFDVFQQMGANPEITRTVILSTIYKAERLPEELKNQLSADAFKAVQGMGPAVLRMLKAVDLRGPLSQCPQEILVLHGQEDLIIPRSDAESLAKILPHAQLEVLTDVGHCWNVEDPAAMTQRLRLWL